MSRMNAEERTAMIIVSFTTMSSRSLERTPLLRLNLIGITATSVVDVTEHAEQLASTAPKLSPPGSCPGTVSKQEPAPYCGETESCCSQWAALHRNPPVLMPSGIVPSTHQVGPTNSTQDWLVEDATTPGACSPRPRTEVVFL